jgi:hypothetical protein
LITHWLSIWDHGTLSKVFEKLFECSWIASANVPSLFDERAYMTLLKMGDSQPASSEPPPQVREQLQFRSNGLICIAVFR